MERNTENTRDRLRYLARCSGWSNQRDRKRERRWGVRHFRRNRIRDGEKSARNVNPLSRAFPRPPPPRAFRS